MKKIAVIGAGSWGTALAVLLAPKADQVVIWAYLEEEGDAINNTHRNGRYLSDVVLPDNISATSSYAEAVADAEAIVVVTPSAFLRNTARELAPYVAAETPLIICSKGIEDHTGLLPVEIFAEVLGNPERLAALSGPNHAEEVIKKLPAATVIASFNSKTAEFFQELFADDWFRTYVSTDPIGVELCGAFKNIIAIAVGVAYGMGFGDNTAAMLITRGLAEMSRLVVKCGGDAYTSMGLAGTGDMIATCMSQHSRNRRFGQYYLSEGKTVQDFQDDTHMVVEGALACRTITVLAERYGVELPITDVVREVIWGDIDSHEAAKQLIERPLTTEFYGIEPSA